ncbi:MAG: transporter [bacterium]|jgi:hypothetical protein
MRRSFVMLIVFIFLAMSADACDVCGCGNNGNYIGILPEFQKRLVGLRFRCNALKTHVGRNGRDTYMTTHEVYNTLELWSSYKVSKKLNLVYYVPFNFNSKQTTSQTSTISGIGDAGINAFYSLFNKNTLTSFNKVFIHELRVAGGLKLPTGKYKNLQDGLTSQLFTLGTGSLDLNLGAVYEARLNNTGLNLSTNFKLNSRNNQGYQYGNKLQHNIQLYQKMFIGEKYAVSPNIGVQFERTSKDYFSKSLVDNTGGTLTTGSIGVEIKLKNIFIGANHQLPLSQHIANRMIEAKSRSMIHLSFSF